MGLFTWIKGLLQPQGDTIRVNCQTMPLAKWEATRRRRDFNPPAPGNKPAAPAELPSDQLMEQWRGECRQLSADSNYAIPASSFMAHRVVAWTRQQQAQSLQLPPPGADPVATDEQLAYVWIPPCTYEDARRAIYDRGRADERTAIVRALGMEP